MQIVADLKNFGEASNEGRIHSVARASHRVPVCSKSKLCFCQILYFSQICGAKKIKSSSKFMLRVSNLHDDCVVRDAFMVLIHAHISFLLAKQFVTLTIYSLLSVVILFIRNIETFAWNRAHRSSRLPRICICEHLPCMHFYIYPGFPCVHIAQRWKNSAANSEAPVIDAFRGSIIAAFFMMHKTRKKVRGMLTVSLRRELSRKSLFSIWLLIDAKGMPMSTKNAESLAADTKLTTFRLA